MKKAINRIKYQKIPLFSLLLAALLYLPSLFEPISYGDECIYLTLGNAFRKGLVFYRDIHDNKPPLLYLVAALANGNLFWFRLFSLTIQLIHLYLIFKIVKLLTGRFAAAISSSLVFILLSLIFEGRIANGEVFMMVPATAAVYLILKYSNRKDLKFGLLLGFLFSIGFLFKVPVFFDMVGIVLGVWFVKIRKINPGSIIKLIRSGVILGLGVGFSLPILLTIFYYSSKGAFTPYVRSALLQNIGYLSSWQGSSSGLMIRAFLLLILFLGITYLIRKKFISHILGLFLIWFIFSLFGSLLSGRPYPHYFIEVVPSLSVIAGLAIARKKARYYLAAASSFLLLLASHRYFNFWWYPQISYYQNFVSFLVGKKTPAQYYQYWGEKVRENYHLSDFIKRSTTEEDRVFIWGDGACIYAISKRLPPGRYTVNYHIFDFNGFKETLQAIKKNKPRIIIKLADEKREFEKLDHLIEREYIRFYLEGTNSKVFLLKNGWLSKFEQ